MRNRISARVIAACIVVAGCLTTPAFGAAVDYFLKLDGVDGESRLEPGAVDVDGYSYEIRSPRDAASGQASGKRSAAGGGGGGSVSDITFMCKLGKATPKLMLACATGEHIKQAILVCRKTGGDGIPVTFLKITMSDVMVSSYSSTGASGDVVPTDSFSLNFTKIEFRFSWGETQTGLVWDSRSQVWNAF
jgi:type VI secretion system secreted protein Hcp